MTTKSFKRLSLLEVVSLTYCHDVINDSLGLNIHGPGSGHDSVLKCSIISSLEVGVEVEPVLRGQSPVLVHLPTVPGPASQSEPDHSTGLTSLVSPYKLYYIFHCRDPFGAFPMTWLVSVYYSSEECGKLRRSTTSLGNPLTFPFTLPFPFPLSLSSSPLLS